MIEDCSESDKIIEHTDLDEFKVVDSPEQHDTSEVLLGVVLAPAMDTNSISGIALYEFKGVLESCTLELTCARSLKQLTSETANQLNS